MKHLKKFNESLEYQNIQISEEEYTEECGGIRIRKNLTLLNSHEVDELRRFFCGEKTGSKLTLEYLYDISFETDPKSNEVCIICKDKKGYKNIYISKYNDDWFYLCLEVSTKTEYDQKYWKCDQFGGVMQELNKIMSKEKKILDDIKKSIIS